MYFIDAGHQRNEHFWSEQVLWRDLRLVFVVKRCLEWYEFV